MNRGTRRLPCGIESFALFRYGIICTILPCKIRTIGGIDIADARHCIRVIAVGQRPAAAAGQLPLLAGSRQQGDRRTNGAPAFSYDILHIRGKRR